LLKTGLMIEEYEKKKRKQIASMRALLDYGVGSIITLAGLFFFFRSKFDISFNETFPPNVMDKIFGVICFMYGSWRIYRGYKKNYFK
jgi:hypothetical protein